MRTIIAFTVALATVGVAAHAEAQGRYNRGASRNDVAHAQGVPPGQLPPANLCRVWYSDRSPGRQPAATDCRTAELTVSRNRNARVIYGQNAYDDRYYGVAATATIPTTVGTIRTATRTTAKRCHEAAGFAIRVTERPTRPTADAPAIALRCTSKAIEMGSRKGARTVTGTTVTT